MNAIPDSLFLNDYILFGLWHPALASRQLISSHIYYPDHRKAIALEIFRSHFHLLETLVTWYFALKSWQPGVTSLVKCFSDVRLSDRRGSKQSTTVAFDEMRGSTIAEVEKALKQPSDEDMISRGWSVEDLGRRRDSLQNVVTHLTSGIERRVLAGGAALRGYNAIKHASKIMAYYPAASTSESFVVVGRARNAGSDAFLADIWEIPCDDKWLRQLVSETRSLSIGLHMILAVVHWFYYDQRPWPEYQQYLLETSTFRLGSTFIDRDELESVFSSSQ